MVTLGLDDRVELNEFLEQINYALSLEFKEKWRHKFSENFINIFQNKIINAFQSEKPIKLSVLISLYTKKYRYDPKLVSEFLRNIDISLYSPLIQIDCSCSFLS